VIVSRKMAEEACETLGWGKETLSGDGPTTSGINAQFRTAAGAAHPDKGGTAEAFVALDRARHVLLAWLERQAEAPAPSHGGAAECPRCHGAGRIMMHRGVRQMPMQCPACQGNGEIYDDRESTGDRL
jgi:hypothetical protein